MAMLVSTWLNNVGYDMAIVTEDNFSIVEPLEMRNAMGKFLTGVTIVTIV